MRFVFLLALLFVSTRQQLFGNYHPRFLSNLRSNQLRSLQDLYLPLSHYVGDEPQNSRYWRNKWQDTEKAQDDDEESETSEEKNYFVEPRRKGGYWGQEQLDIDEERPSNRLFYNQGGNGILAQQFGFPFKTQVYTTVRTKTITSMINCIPVSLLAKDATTCARRRRDIHSDSESAISPSPLQKLETTTIALPPHQNLQFDEIPNISSSKDDIELQETGTNRAKRLLLAGRTTLTSWRFTTTTVPRRVNLAILLAGASCPAGTAAGQCALACVPPGYSIC